MTTIRTNQVVYLVAANSRVARLYAMKNEIKNYVYVGQAIVLSGLNRAKVIIIEGAYQNPEFDKIENQLELLSYARELELSRDSL